MASVVEPAIEQGATLSRRSALRLSSAALLTTWASRSQATEKTLLNNNLPAELKAGIEQRRKEILEAMAQCNVPGAAVSLVYRGEVVWAEGFGVTDRASHKPVGTDTMFSIQSISKNFTATAIMLAVQKGILDLDTPISRYVPDFTVHSRFEAAPEKKITLRLLLSHRAGFTHEAPIGNNYYPAFPGFEAHVRSISDTWLRYPVGERYSYSNLGVDLAGYILQKAGGVPFEQFVKTMLFDPLGMTNTTFSSSVYTAAQDRAAGYEPGYDAVPLITPLIPSGGVWTSVKDMGAYARFHLNKGMAGGTRMLDRRLWETMHTLQFDEHYCLAITRNKLKFGQTVIDWFNHNGGGFGFGAKFSFYPADGLAWIALFNNAEGPVYARFGESLVEDILARTYGKPAALLSPESLNAVELPKALLESYTGKYAARGEYFITFRFDGDAFGMLQDGVFRKLTFLSPAEAFAVGGINAHMFRFDAARAGETARVEWPNGPSDLDYNDGPKDVAGPNEKRWTKYPGDYQVMQWGKPSKTRSIRIRNGYLYVDDLRVIAEYERGLFFTSDGEALDFRGNVPTFANIPLNQV